MTTVVNVWEKNTMANQEDKEILSEYLKDAKDTIEVARILVKEEKLHTPSLVVDFFEKPSKWEKSMRNIVGGES